MKKEVGELMVPIDSQLLKSALLNLFVNAAQAMPDGGNLSVEIGNDRENCIICIEDTGMGIAQENLDKIFTPFFTTKEKDKGTGLGLATVDGIVKQSGGHITVYSEPNQGTTVKVYLPHTEVVEAKEAEVHILNGHSHNAETILLVEDEASIKEVAKEILETQGYRVLEASSEDALTISQEFQGKIDLLLTDVVMPKMNGRELAELLSNQRLDLRVLYMSGYTDNVIIHHGILKPHIAFLQKPFTSQTLTEKVRAVLDS